MVTGAQKKNFFSPAVGSGKKAAASHSEQDSETGILSALTCLAESAVGELRSTVDQYIAAAINMAARDKAESELQEAINALSAHRRSLNQKVKIALGCLALPLRSGYSQSSFVHSLSVDPPGAFSQLELDAHHDDELGKTWKQVVAAEVKQLNRLKTIQSALRHSQKWSSIRRQWIVGILWFLNQHDCIDKGSFYRELSARKYDGYFYPPAGKRLGANMRSATKSDKRRFEKRFTDCARAADELGMPTGTHVRSTPNEVGLLSHKHVGMYQKLFPNLQTDEQRLAVDENRCTVCKRRKHKQAAARRSHAQMTT